MSQNPALFRPDGPAVADLCVRLRAVGVVRAGPEIELRLRAAFARLPPRERAAVGRVVRAVCLDGGDEAERAKLDAALRPWLATLRPAVSPTVQPRSGTVPAHPLRRDVVAPEPSTAVAPEPSRRRWLVAAVIGLAAITGAVLLAPAEEPHPEAHALPDSELDGDMASRMVSDAGPDGIDATPDVIDAALPDVGPIAPAPTLTSRPELRPGDWPASDVLAALFGLMLGALLLGLRALRLERLRPDEEPPPPPATPPPPIPLPPDPPPRILPRDADARLAAGSGRAVLDPERRALDVSASVRATAARAGKIPALRFRPLRHPEPLHIWVDWPARTRTPTLGRAVDELRQALTRGGVSYTELHFTHRFDRLMAGGRPVTLDGLTADRRATQVAIITDAHGLMRIGDRARHRLVEQLEGWSHLAVFVFGTVAPSAMMDRFRGVLALPGDALLPWLVRIEPGTPPPVDPRDMQIWAGACALIGRAVTDDEAFELARALALDGVPPTALEALRADADGGGLRWAPARRAERVNWLSRSAPGAMDAAIEWWSTRAGARAADTGAPLELRERARVEAAALALWTDDLDAVSHAARGLVALGRPATAESLLFCLCPTDIDHPSAIRLPWSWAALTDPESRRTLRALGLQSAIERLPVDSFERPPRSRPLVGLAVGLLGAAGLGAFIAPPDEVYIDTPCVQTRTAADGDNALIWLCGNAAVGRPDHPSWPAHSAVGLFTSPLDASAAELALTLLDVSAADSVWWGALPSPAEADQRIAVVPASERCPDGATACIAVQDWTALREAIGPKPKPLSEVWPSGQGQGWLLGRADAEDRPDAADADAAIDTSVDDTSVSEHDAGTDAADRSALLTDVEAGLSSSGVLTLRVRHTQGPRLEVDTVYRNELLVVRIGNGRWHSGARRIPFADHRVTWIATAAPNMLHVQLEDRTSAPEVSVLRREGHISVEIELGRGSEGVAMATADMGRTADSGVADAQPPGRAKPRIETLGDPELERPAQLGDVQLMTYLATEFVVSVGDPQGRMPVVRHSVEDDALVLTLLAARWPFSQRRFTVTDRDVHEVVAMSPNRLVIRARAINPELRPQVSYRPDAVSVVVSRRDLRRPRDLRPSQPTRSSRPARPRRIVRLQDLPEELPAPTERDPPSAGSRSPLLPLEPGQP